MEIVNSLVMSPAEFLLQLDRPAAFGHFRLGYPVVAFLLSRSAETPRLFAELLDHASSIDSTTRREVAFVLFHSERRMNSAIPTTTGGAHARGWDEVEVDGMTVIDQAFDSSLAEHVREEPQQLSVARFASEMTRATDVLVDRYELLDSDLPCVLFVNTADPKEYVTASLPVASIFRDLYTVVLKPLSEALRLHSRCRKAKRDLANAKVDAIRERRMDARVKHLEERIRQADKELDVLATRLSDGEYSLHRDLLLNRLQKFTGRQRKRVRACLDALDKLGQTPLTNMSLPENQRLDLLLSDFDREYRSPTKDPQIRERMSEVQSQVASDHERLLNLKASRNAERTATAAIEKELSNLAQECHSRGWPRISGKVRRSISPGSRR
jgi:hypothetical protein